MYVLIAILENLEQRVESRDIDPRVILKRLETRKTRAEPLSYLAIACIDIGEEYSFSIDRAIAGSDPHLRLLAWRAGISMEDWVEELFNDFKEELCEVA